MAHVDVSITRLHTVVRMSVLLFRLLSFLTFMQYSPNSYRNLIVSLCAWSGPQHSVCRSPGSGQVQCASWRRCEAHSARTRHNTTCIKQGYKTSARRLPLESLTRGCSGSRFFCVPGHAVQGRSSRAPSPARPRFDPDHALPFVLLPHFRQVDSLSTTGK
jgi:hypothetical protein